MGQSINSKLNQKDDCENQQYNISRSTSCSQECNNSILEVYKELKIFVTNKAISLTEIELDSKLMDKDSKNNNILHLACKNGNFDIIKYLLKFENHNLKNGLNDEMFYPLDYLVLFIIERDVCEAKYLESLFKKLYPDSFLRDFIPKSIDFCIKMDNLEVLKLLSDNNQKDFFTSFVKLKDKNKKSIFNLIAQNNSSKIQDYIVEMNEKLFENSEEDFFHITTLEFKERYEILSEAIKNDLVSSLKFVLNDEKFKLNFESSLNKYEKNVFFLCAEYNSIKCFDFLKEILNKDIIKNNLFEFSQVKKINENKIIFYEKSKNDFPTCKFTSNLFYIFGILTLFFKRLQLIEDCLLNSFFNFTERIPLGRYFIEEEIIKIHREKNKQKNQEELNRRINGLNSIEKAIKDNNIEIFISIYEFLHENNALEKEILNNDFQKVPLRKHILHLASDEGNYMMLDTVLKIQPNIFCLNHDIKENDFIEILCETSNNDWSIQYIDDFLNSDFKNKET